MPDGVKRGFLRLVDSQNNTLGQAEINLDNYIHVKEGDEILETQTLFAKQKKEGETPVAIADLKYTFLNGKVDRGCKVIAMTFLMFRMEATFI